MMKLLPAPVRGVLNALLLCLNTLTVFCAMIPPALVKLLVPLRAARVACDRALNALAGVWVGINSAWIGAAQALPWDVQGVEGLDPAGWYLVVCNHRSWVDILVLQRIFHRRIPFLKFFLKQQLIWVPVIGLAWWALDFPFMKRGAGHGAHQSDLEATRAACRKFRDVPTAVINFVEGTRFTPAKRRQQKSPYEHLLKPRVGGMGMALATLGRQFESLLDVTIAYPDATPTFWDLLCGRCGRVTVRVASRSIPQQLRDRDPIGDRAFRQELTAWMESLWREKDELVGRLEDAPARAARGRDRA